MSAVLLEMEEAQESMESTRRENTSGMAKKEEDIYGYLP